MAETLWLAALAVLVIFVGTKARREREYRHDDALVFRYVYFSYTFMRQDEVARSNIDRSRLLSRDRLMKGWFAIVIYSTLLLAGCAPARSINSIEDVTLVGVRRNILLQRDDTVAPPNDAGIYRINARILQADVPQSFAPGVISQPDTGGITFTPDGQTAYFTKNATIMVSHLKGGQWSAPEVAPFSGKYREGDPSMTPDGSRLFYWSLRPAAGKPTEGWWPDLWYVVRKGDGWSEPRSVGGGPSGEWSPFSLGTGTPSQAADGTLYFFRCIQHPCTATRIVRSKPKNGHYVDYEDLGETINWGNTAFDMTVAPDQSFIVFSAKRPDSLGDYDLYISYQKGSTWSEPRNLGPNVNSAGGEYSPKLSPDGKRLFFTHDGIRFVNMADVVRK